MRAIKIIDERRVGPVAIMGEDIITGRQRRRMRRCASKGVDLEAAPFGTSRAFNHHEIGHPELLAEFQRFLIVSRLIGGERFFIAVEFDDDIARAA